MRKIDFTGRLNKKKKKHIVFREIRRGRIREEETVLLMIWSLGGGGAERVVSILASELAKHYHVGVICFEKKEKEFPVPDSVERFYMPSFAYDEYDTWIKYVRLIKETRNTKASISFMYAMNRMNTETAGACRVICSERNNPMRKEPDHFTEIQQIYKSADHVVFQSETVRNLFGNEIRRHSSILPNPVSVSCVCQKERRHRIVNIGRLHLQKNQAMLIRAFGEFYKTHPEYTLSIYGDGEQRQILEALSMQLDLGEVVEFHGNVENIHEQISDAEIFVLSSDYEGLSNALLECMMMGMVCISTACEGSADVIRSGENGMLVPVGDEDSLAEALCYLADHPDARRQMETAALKSAEKFRTESVIQQWMGLIEVNETDR